jgi:hypothetical protein
VEVDTGQQVQALTERLERVEQALRAMDTAAAILARAGMDDGMRDAAGWHPERRPRHLRPVE